MNMNQQQSPSHGEQFRSMVGWLTFICGALAVSVEVFLHRSRTIGERYLGLKATAVIAIVPLYSLFWQGHDVMPLMRFLGMFLFMCFITRVGQLQQRQRGGPQVHTRYTGYPRICSVFRQLSERTAKMMVEPMLVFLVGVFVIPESEPLGGYLMLASVGLLISVHMSVGYDRVRALDLHDAALDQRGIATQFRDLRGGE